MSYDNARIACNYETNSAQNGTQHGTRPGDHAPLMTVGLVFLASRGRPPKRGARPYPSLYSLLTKKINFIKLFFTSIVTAEYNDRKLQEYWRNENIFCAGAEHLGKRGDLVDDDGAGK